MKTDAQKVLNFLVAKLDASEDKPAKFGNVEFWHPVPGFPAGLCYSMPFNQWDIQSVQDDLNKVAETHWDDLIKYLKGE